MANLIDPTGNASAQLTAASISVVRSLHLSDAKKKANLLV